MSITRSLTRPVTSSLTRSITKAQRAGGGWTPARLFGASEKGFVHDYTLASLLYQDSARTTLVSTNGDPIGSVTDLSPNGAHASQATGINRPTFNGYAEFDGSNDSLATAAIDFSGTDKVTVVACIRKNSDAAVAVAFELTPNYFTNTGSFFMSAPASTATGNYSAGSRGVVAQSSNQIANSPSSFAAPITNVITNTHDIAGDLTTTRYNGTASTSAVGDKGAGNFANAQVFIGARGGASARLNGRIYRAVIIGRALTDDERNLTEAWCGAPAGIFF